MNPIPIEQAQGRLVDILSKFPLGDEVVLTKSDQPVAILKGVGAAVRTSRRFGTLRGSILAIASDFDAIPEGFED